MKMGQVLDDLRVIQDWAWDDLWADFQKHPDEAHVFLSLLRLKRFFGLSKAEPDDSQIAALLNKKARLDYLRRELRAERISYDGIAELQSLAAYIPSDDVELLEAAGVPEKLSAGAPTWEDSGFDLCAGCLGCPRCQPAAPDRDYDNWTRADLTAELRRRGIIGKPGCPVPGDLDGITPDEIRQALRAYDSADPQACTQAAWDVLCGVGR